MVLEQHIIGQQMRVVGVVSVQRGVQCARARGARSHAQLHAAPRARRAARVHARATLREALRHPADENSSLK